MLPEGVLSIAIRADFWQPQKNETQAELIKYCCPRQCEHIDNTHITFNGPLSRTTRVGRYQEGKTNLDFTEARDSEWQ